MPFDTHSLFGYSTVATVVSQNATTVILTVGADQGSWFAVNQQVTVWPTNALPLLSNAMVGRITAVSNDELTINISSANREGSSVRTVIVGDQIANSITPKAFTDIEDDLSTLSNSFSTHNHTLASLSEKSYLSLTNTPDLSTLHTHANKALLDTYDQTNANLADAVTKKHAHANQTALDAVSGVNTGDQDLSVFQAHILNTNNPHSVTKAQVGLANVDNTSDANKPISTATQTVLDGKVDENSAITGATKTKITYDAKGLVTAGADATTSDITEGSNLYYTDARVRNNRLDQMAAPTVDVSMNSQKITNLGTPSAATDAVTKGYVDAVKQALDIKDSVRVATTANGTLASDFENGDVIDGVTLATNDRILIKNQSTGSQNGIYVVNASGAPTRATDADASSELTAGMFVFVEEGTVHGNDGFVLTTDGPITLGTTALTFTQFSGAGQFVGGQGISISGNEISVNTDDSTIEVISNTLRIVPGGVTNSEIADDTIDLTAKVTGALPVTNGGTGATTAADARTNLGLAAGGTGDIWVEKAGDTMTGALNANAGLGVGGGSYNLGSYLFDVVKTSGASFCRIRSDTASDTGLRFENANRSWTAYISGSSYVVRDSSGSANRLLIDTSGVVTISTGNLTTASNTNLSLVPNGTGYTVIGDAGTTSHTLNTNDDLLVSGRLEVDGVVYFDNKPLISKSSVNAEFEALEVKNTGTSGLTFNTVGILFTAVNGDAKILAGNETSGSGNDGFLAFYTRTSDALGLTEKVRIQGDGYMEISTPNAAPTISSNGRISFYLDEAGNALKVAVKYSNGTTKTGSVALT